MLRRGPHERRRGRRAADDLPVRAIVVGGAAGRVLEDLEAAFDVPVLEAYGMTEAAHQMTSNPLPDRVRKPGTVGLAAGPEVAVLDGDGTASSRPAPTGEVAIRVHR